MRSGGSPSPQPESSWFDSTLSPGAVAAPRSQSPQDPDTAVDAPDAGTPLFDQLVAEYRARLLTTPGETWSSMTSGLIAE